MLGKIMQRSVDDENTTYINIGRFRLIFKYGKYIGWYNTKLGRVLK